jgi:glycosyltransferase involved in cell wall biosynthesis
VRIFLKHNPSTPSAMIGILVPEFPSQTQIFLWREIEQLRALGEEVAVVATRRANQVECKHAFAAETRDVHYLFPPRLGAALGVLARHPGRAAQALGYLIGLKQTPWPKRALYGGLLLCAADLRQHARRLRLRHIHAHSCADVAHIAALCRILGGPPYSLTLHGDLPVYGTDHASKMARALFVSTDGPHLRGQILEHVPGVSSDRILTTWMGLDVDRFRDNGRRRYEPNRLHLVTVARLHRCKGHKHALAAMRRALDRGLDLRYSLAGAGPHRGEIEAEVERLGLRDRVELLGTLAEPEVLELLQRADVFVLPSVGLGEAGPISVMEAMACGLPVICSIIGATPVMVDPGVTGILVPQRDEAGLAEAFARLAADAALRRAMGQAARARALAMFDVRATARRLLQAINDPSAVPALAAQAVAGG